MQMQLVKTRSPWHGGEGALSQYDGVLMKGGNLDTETDMHTGRMWCVDVGRDGGDAFTSQGTPKMASKPPEAGRRAWSRFPPHSLKGTNLTSAFQPPELADNEFLCVSPLSCGTLL